MAETSRPGLYLMVFLAVLNSCGAENEASKAAKALKQIADRIAANEAQAKQ